MRRTKFQYILTWVSLVLMIICSTLLVAYAWNSKITGPISPSLMMMLWIGIAASGIFLFMLAVKKAHRLWIDEERYLERMEQESKKKSFRTSGSSREKKELDFAAAAKKIIRRIPENIAQEQLGKLLLKNLARELELMSGIFYREHKEVFKAEATYAMASTTEPYTFKSGEGLSGQVAKNQQLMVLTHLPEGHLEVYSGLGKAPPAYLAIVPLVHKGKTMAVIECSGYRYDPDAIENMFKILARDLMDKLSLNLS
ncbi:MAG: hypothetical protein DRJ29_14020 [Bacteroidetes bacterium]|nr:MAG: hypothetical protein DRJ29_14020 [Bacteroidota bacterium]